MEGLIQNRLINVSDQIEFVFKKYVIRGRVGFHPVFTSSNIFIIFDLM